ncbi:MAG: peptide-methionine (S)-S-oxide reductase MsrA [Flavipsychrobacter sp.]|nr:peptide-methionine (S)-S-oxide reductase MsrA [Flavipsychrobacter sp.]
MKHTTFYLFVLLACCLASCAQGTKVSQNLKQVSAVDTLPTDLYKYKTAIFAAGCFWHEEALFKSIKGVVTAVSGYAGGNATNPTYEDVEAGNTGHSESVMVYYDTSKISYPTLLKVYFESMEDPTQVNGQGPDEGTQYRSLIFYNNLVEKTYADQMISEMNKSGKYKHPVAAQVVPFIKFWKAEDYHQNYVKEHPENPYVQNVSIRDVRKYQEAHPDMVKPGYKL